MKENKLKPCGKCGCSAKIIKKKFQYKCECNECWTETQWYRNIDLAVDAWNKLAETNAIKNTTYRYRYDVCGYTGEVILTGSHSHENIVLAIANDLNYFDYEEVTDNEQSEAETT